MPEPMTDARLAEIEAAAGSVDTDLAQGIGYTVCREMVPDLIAEVRRLREALQMVRNTSDDYGIAYAALEGRPRV